MMVIDLGQTNVGETHFHLGRDQRTGKLVYRQNKQNAWKDASTLPRAIQGKLEKQGFVIVCQSTLKAHNELLAELAHMRRTTTFEPEVLTVSIQ